MSGEHMTDGMVLVDHLLANDALSIIGCATPLKRPHTTFTDFCNSLSQTIFESIDMRIKYVQTKIEVIAGRFRAIVATVGHALDLG